MTWHPTHLLVLCAIAFSGAFVGAFIGAYVYG